MFTRIDKAIAAGIAAGALVAGYGQAATGTAHNYVIVAAVAAGIIVGAVTFIVPNKPA